MAGFFTIKRMILEGCQKSKKFPLYKDERQSYIETYW